MRPAITGGVPSPNQMVSSPNSAKLGTVSSVLAMARMIAARRSQRADATPSSRPSTAAAPIARPTISRCVATCGPRLSQLSAMYRRMLSCPTPSVARRTTRSRLVPHAAGAECNRRRGGIRPVRGSVQMSVVAWLGFVVGVAMVLTTLASVVVTLVVPRGVSSRLTNAVTGAVSGLFRMLAGRRERYEDRDQLLSLAGPAVLVATLATWLALVYFGFALQLWPMAGNSFPKALEVAGSSMFTLGFATLSR